MAFSLSSMSSVDPLGHYTDTPTTAFKKVYTSMNVAQQAEINSEISKIHLSSCNKLMKEINKKSKPKDPDAPKKEQPAKLLEWQDRVRKYAEENGMTFKDSMVELKKQREADEAAAAGGATASSKKKPAKAERDTASDAITSKMTALSLNTIKPAATSGPSSSAKGTVKSRTAPPPPPPPIESDGEESEYEDVPLTKIQRNGKFYYTTPDGEEYKCNDDNSMGGLVGYWDPKTRKHNL